MAGMPKDAALNKAQIAWYFFFVLGTSPLRSIHNSPKWQSTGKVAQFLLDPFAFLRRPQLSNMALGLSLDL